MFLGGVPGLCQEITFRGRWLQNIGNMGQRYLEQSVENVLEQNQPQGEEMSKEEIDRNKFWGQNSESTGNHEVPVRENSLSLGKSLRHQGFSK